MGTCAIDHEAALWCWGAAGLADEQRRPARLGDEHDWEQVATGPALACGLRAGGALWCWGSLEFSLEGVARRFEPTHVPGVWRAVDSHWYRTVAVRDDGALAFFGHYGHSGTNEPDSTAAAIFGSPLAIDTSAKWRDVRVGVLFAYAVAADGSVWQLHHDDPSWVPLGAQAAWPTSASAGYNLCVLEDGGAVACHERSHDEAGLPLARMPGRYVSVAHQMNERCAVDTDAATWCWPAPNGIALPTARRVP
jgi:hypothetical protein